MMRKQNQQDNGLSWGTGLFIAIVVFICATLSVVGFLISLDYEMVTDNHYEKAVNYQQHIDRVVHNRALEEPVTIAFLAKENRIRLHFPASLSRQNPRGTVALYRPSNSAMDQRIPLALDEEGMQHINARNLAGGKWTVKVRWTVNEQRYYKETDLFL